MNCIGYGVTKSWTRLRSFILNPHVLICVQLSGIYVVCVCDVCMFLMYGFTESSFLS